MSSGAQLPPPAPIRSSMFDGRGTMSLDWQRYFLGLFSLGVQVVDTASTVTDVVEAGSALAFDSGTTPRDPSAAIDDSLQGDLQRPVRDYTPDIEAAVRAALQDASTPQVTRADLDELNSRLVQDARTPRVVPADLDDIYSRLASLESPNRGSASNAAITDFDAAGAAEEISRQQAQPLVRDYTPDIEAVVRSVLQDARTPRVVPADLDDIYSRLASVESVNRGSASNAAVTDFDAAGAAEEISRQQAQPLVRDYTPDIEAAVRSVLLEDGSTSQVRLADLDEMRSLIASLDTPRANGFEGWQNWTPTYSCSGAMTFALASTAFAVFLRVGSTVFFAIQVNFTLGGTANIAVFASLPVPGVGVGVGGGNMSVNTNIINGGTAPWVPSFGFVDAGNQRLNVATPTAANWTLGGAWFSCQGFYQIK